MRRTPPERDRRHEALIRAIDHHDEARLRAMLEDGVDLASEDRMQPLFAAALDGFEAGVDLLLAAGAEVDTRSRGQAWKGMTPLMAAVLEEHPSLVVKLLDAGADPDLALDDGRTAALLALQGTRGASPPGPAMAELLFARGASREVPAHCTETLLAAAAKRGHAAFVREWLTGDAVFGGSFAHCAATGNLAAARAWIDAHGAGTPDPWIGWPPIYWACLFDRGALVTRLCQAGEDPEQRRPVEYRPGLVAVKARAAAALASLLRAGSPPASRPEGGGLLTLSEACTRLPDQTLTSTLLDAWGFGSAAEPRLGRLHTDCFLWCLWHGFEPEARRLLAAGVKPNARSEGFAPILIAAMHDHAGLVALLLEFGAKPDLVSHGWRPLHWAIGRARRTVIDALIAGGAALDKPDPHGNTPLHLAVRAGRAEVYRKLIDAGAVETKKNRARRTPREEAVLLGLATRMGFTPARERPAAEAVFAAFAAPSCDTPPSVPWADGDADELEHVSRGEAYGLLASRRFDQPATYRGDHGAYAPIEHDFKRPEDHSWLRHPDPLTAQHRRFRQAAESVDGAAALGMLLCIHNQIVLDVVAAGGVLLCFPMVEREWGDVPHAFALRWDGERAWVATSDPQARANPDGALHVASVPGATPDVLANLLPPATGDAPCDLTAAARWLDQAFERGLAGYRGWCQ